MVTNVLNEITIDAKQLRDALALAVVARKTTMSILEYVCLKPAGGVIVVFSTDVDSHVSTGIEGTASTNAPILIPYRKVVDLLKDEQGAVTIAYQETVTTAQAHKAGSEEVKPGRSEFAVTLKVGECVYKLPSLSVQNFPVFPEINSPDFQVDGEALREMIAHVFFAIRKDESRYTISGLLLKAEKDQITLCATDGHRLAIETREAGIAWKAAHKEPLSAVIPRDAVEWLSKHLDKAPVEVAVSEKRVSFSMPGMRTVFCAPKLSCQFPNYEAVMPRKTARTFTAQFLSADVLAKAVAKVAKMANEKTRCVRFSLSDSCILSTSNSGNGSAQATVSANVSRLGNAHDLAVGLNADYVLDGLKIAGKGEVLMAFESSTRAATIEIPNFPGFEYVVMPLRV